MKIALITGASGDIGINIARDLAKKGWSLYLHYFSNQTRIDKILKEFNEQYPKQEFFPLKVDLQQDDSTEQIINNIYSLNAIVFAHGMTDYGLLETMTVEKMDLLWKIHVKSPVLITQALQHKLHTSGQARIVFISSVYGEMGSSNEVFYSTVKGAQIAFVKAYSKEVASWGITVNAVAPGAIDTHMNQHFSDSERRDLMEDIPLGRMGKPSEISFWVEQILKDDSAYMTGQILTVSGGWLK
ncbi:SDR family oxidoreductase [Jeotgalibaca sp. MA1X17-3]|uniref:elongation factor P 5-aminopentanone reductase n=1 Tax=Jeotgalibaca sp. MA1X17-3 TaxID=2908211 RepID=UPI001F2C1965|nr:SDR family oxidoreductase [Jeotgalibaca sp. MA1X17-3]UJF14873.1 SDR family oxidoreductase [Jeotgalibaca sp. MA1X17-3]